MGKESVFWSNEEERLGKEMEPYRRQHPAAIDLSVAELINVKGTVARSWRGRENQAKGERDC